MELFKDPSSAMLIPFSNGVLQKEFFEFLVYRYHWPTKFNQNLKPINGSSLRNIAYDLKQLLETLAVNNLHFTEVTYDLHLKKILDELQDQFNWKNETYNIKYSRYKNFYEFLTFRGISHHAIFPVIRDSYHYTNPDDDFLSHVRSKGFGNHKFKDDGHKRTALIDNYLENVISIETYSKLYIKLKEIDPVYAVMAQVMMQTCLRISNVCQVPLNQCKLNPNWKLWPEVHALDIDFLKFNHIAKGRKQTWCYFWPETIKSIYRDYIVPHYAERKMLFDKVYKRRKNSSLRQGQVILPEDILWLNKSGTPVKPYMVEEAFRKTGLNVNPHSLRHTGATHLLWNYCKIKNIEPDERMAAQFHSFLQFQLGHHSIETTRYYIRTIINKHAQLVVPFALPSNREELDKSLPSGASESMKMLEFFTGISNGINSFKD